MKNYLIKSLYRIKNKNWQVMDRSHEVDLHENYLQMHDISCASFDQYLQGDWELKFITGEFENISQAFEYTHWMISKYWHQGNCNILYTDPDTVCQKPTDIFNKFDKFMMFNYTEPRTFDRPNPYGCYFENFFNAGVRYFPAAMDRKLWGLGNTLATKWDHSTYDTEQLILNAMLWRQKITLEQALHPEIVYQAPRLPLISQEAQDEWNGVAMSQAHIVHVHGSRDSAVKLNLMKQIRESTK
jgi:hypothetical protein